MTVAVAHQVSTTSRKALAQAVMEARFRGTDLAVLHVVDSVDADRKEAYRLGVSDEIEKVVEQEGSVPWRLHLATAGADLAGALLRLVETVDADLLGSVAQTGVLEGDLPVLVVKAA
jgi:nucleotide-binding universal stress UspA family protein